ncbi:MAG: fatty acid--CoA ligase [Pseudomonadota bacterium]
MTLSIAELDAKIQTLGDIPRVYTDEQPDAKAMKFEGRISNYAQLEQRTNQVANALSATGAKKGARVGYLAKNSDLYFELLFGAAKMGAVTLPIGWRLAPAEIAHILDDGEVSLLFVGAEFNELADSAIKLLGREIRIIDLETSSNDGFTAWRDQESVEDPGITIEPSDTALQLYTSGTTGRPKGVMLTHKNVLELWVNAGKLDLHWNRWTDDDVCLVAMPLSHIAGTGWGVVGLLNGAGLIILREFDPQIVLKLMEPEGISKMLMVPAALNFLLQMPGARDVDYSRLKLIFYGASPIPLDLLRQSMDVFGCDFCQQYGMTETCGTVVYLPPEDHDPNGNDRMRSAGRAMPGVEIKVIDSEGRSLPPGQVGEITTRSSSNMAGYWNNEVATKSTIDDEGWLLTGDAGYLDEDGYLFIHDRVKDMIISGAENIYPAEVESAMFGHPDIAEVAVIGIPDDKWGEAVKAVVALKPGAAADQTGILEFTRSRIAAYKVPKSVDFVDALPRNASGKVLKRTLREPYWAGKKRNVN